LVSFSWVDLEPAEKIELTKSYEDLLRREAIILTSNEDLLKRGFCKLSSDQQKDLLDKFEARLKFEVVLLKKFEDWLHYQQMIEETERDTWIAFLASFEDLIRRQSQLLDSFEMLMKIDCNEAYINITKSTNVTTPYVIPGQVVMFTYTITATGADFSLENVEVEDSMWGEVGRIASLSPGLPETLTINRTLDCSDCNNCMCKVCNFATVCGEVITENGNFTACDVSNEVCEIVNESFEAGPPGEKLTETVEEPAPEVEEQAAAATSEATGKVIVEVTEAPVAQPRPSGCSECSKK
jgi:hypothetical protein